jgi:asparagine synthase (glutamine-hydrolysing)
VCGIVGFTRDPARPLALDAAILRGMLAPISHRGPDQSGIHVEERIAFGHLRLAIVDLEGGRQPRVDAATGDALVFNGEIYGFGALAAELTNDGVNLADRSDTEVLFRLLQRRGVAATLEKIDGMFAFAYYEGRSGRLYLARDRFGEKPLYFLERGGALLFGSEPQAVLAHPLSKDVPVALGAVATFLAFEYLPGSQSLRQGLRKLPPGHLLTSFQGRIELHCYWHPDPDDAGKARAAESEDERLDRLEAILDKTVRDRLIADVPVGVFLSGGVDSSLVAALVARHAPGLTAITVAMQEVSYDETPAARALAGRLGLVHEIVPLDDASLIESFDALARRMDEPMADSSLLPTHALCRLARQRVKVALGGDGADELFAGYVNFPANRFARGLAQVPSWVGRAARGLLSAFPHNSSYMSLDFLLRQLSQGVGLEPARQWVACMAPFAPEELEQLWLPDALAAAATSTEDPVAELLARRAPRRWSTAELIHLFATTYLPENILQKVDRGSMFASLEVRTPYLGRAFAEYAMSLPSTDKIRGFSTKYLLKKLALRYVPRDIVERPKHGFAVPLARLLRGPLRERIADVMLASNGPLSHWFRHEMIERLWLEHQTGRRDHRKKIWTLFTLATAVRNTATPVQRDQRP